MQGFMFRSVIRGFRTSCGLDSRIKRRHTHKPFWQIKKSNQVPNEPLTFENKAWIAGLSPLKEEFAPWERQNWERSSIRSGIIAQKIGLAPLWTKSGVRIMSTLLQVKDNHVVRYIPAEEYASTHVGEKIKAPKGITDTPRGLNPVLVVGADSRDPSTFTKGYCGLFNGSGVSPKRILSRFIVSPNAILKPGTPLYASHFQVGAYVDVRGTGIRRGFQGVMKRWGFHGMPSDNRGATKTHRRPGSIGSGCQKSRVWPGQKLPGLMGGNKMIMPALQILRINHKEGVLYVTGQGIPGNTGDFVQVFDTRHPVKSLKESPKFFPTCITDDLDYLPDEEYADHIHRFDDDSIVFQ
ncbi:large ribosomal subunit protein uL3m [Lepeophtheirus salmonis]|uniref:Large ribosomal subunit protein uL3m n=2 Tax=Lepeophtheirus salmonis TaxID=72036 RepID=D3PFN4_LEPSM|nr:39S ribosomal protein L3, mitochondrial-like [Lepeophtheirus salmonis]ADD24080.1 39S ribosomal protein L3, mitochondrial [Lepeophtheirus salmonis]